MSDWQEFKKKWKVYDKETAHEAMEKLIPAIEKSFVVLSQRELAELLASFLYNYSREYISFKQSTKEAKYFLELQQKERE